MKKTISVIIGYLLISGSALNVSAQDISGVLTAGAIIDKAVDAADEVIEIAMDRMDQTLLLAGMQARSTVARAALEFENQRARTLEDFDGTQRAMLSDMLKLEDEIEKDMSSLLSDADDSANKYVSSLNLLVSSVPGALLLNPGVEFSGAEMLDIKLSGVALSKLNIVNLRANNTIIDPQFRSRDDTEATLMIPVSGSQYQNVSQPTPVNVSFEIHKKKFFPWLKPNIRYYATEGFLIPKDIGTVSVTFVGEINVTDREPKKIGPFTTPRAKSDWKGKSKSKTSHWTATPDTGWKIDLETAKYTFKLLNSGCSGSRSHSTWTSQTDTGLTVRAKGATDRKSGATCKTNTVIYFDQVRSDDQRTSVESNPANAFFDEKLSFDLSQIAPEIKSARLAHVTLKSSWGFDNESIILTQSKPGPLNIEYNPSTQLVYVTPEF